MQWQQDDHIQQPTADKIPAALYRSLFANLSTALVIADATGAIVEANPAAAALLGYTAAELTQRRISELLVIDRAVAAARASVQQAPADAAQWQGRWTVRHCDQSRITLDVTLSMIATDAGPLYAVLSHTNTVRRAEAPLPLLRAALEQANDAVVITTGELDWPGPQIVYVNQAFTRMTGYSAEEAIGQTPRILQGPATDRAVLRRTRTALERGEAVHDELINYRKDRTPYAMEWRIAPVRDAAGTITHWVSVQRDVTAQKQATDERERLYHEAQAALSGRDQLLMMVSHELKTPLTSMMGYAHLLQRTTLNDGQNSGRLQQAVKVIVEQTQRLNVLIEALLDLTRIQDGSLSLERQTFDLGRLAQEVVDEFQPILERHTLTLRAPDPPYFIDGDQLRLRHALQQLVQNAISYSPRGGPIEMRIVSEPDQVCLSVTDRGIGVPAHAQQQIFERFYRAGNVNPSQISGFGVGLYVVHEIITRHGGTVTVSSTEGQGSTFTICLPRDE